MPLPILIGITLCNYSVRDHPPPPSADGITDRSLLHSVLSGADSYRAAVICVLLRNEFAPVQQVASLDLLDWWSPAPP
eukprot:3694772-Amphidinium_carterae.1